MNKRINCYDVVEMVINEASNQFAPRWKRDEECLKILRQYCEVIDMLSDEFEGKYFEVGVDDVDMTISIKMGCPDCTIETLQHNFYKLIKKAVSFSFTHGEGDNVDVEFVFPSVWEKV